MKQLVDPGHWNVVRKHDRNYPYVLVRLDKIGKKKWRIPLVQCWKELASPRLVKEWEGTR